MENFNPLRREGGDSFLAIHPNPPGKYFNPLRREGGDGIYTPSNDWGPDFNPLRREGGDCEKWRIRN